MLAIDLTVLAKIKDVGLTAPAKKTDLNEFLNTLAKAEEEFKKRGQANVSSNAQVKTQETAKAEVYLN